MTGLAGPEAPRISLLGSTAMLLEAPGPLNLEQQRRIWALASQTQTWVQVQEAVPGMNNLLLVFNSPPDDLAPMEKALQQAWNDTGTLPHQRLGGRTIELPVVYGGEAGPHFGDVMAHTGLSADDIVRIHTEPLYVVYALGSHPGYCYLGGMDPRIATPRRKVPVVNLPGGSVSIGGIQTGVSASDGPSGWSTIGRTDMCFFDPQRDPPALLSPGDNVRFTVERIDR